MSTKTTCQCPNCELLFSNQRSLKLHLPSCRRMHLAVDDSHHQSDHHPLQSSHYIDNASSLNQDGYSDGAINDYNDDDSLASIFSADSSMTSDDFDNADRFVNNYEEAQQQQSLRNAIS